MKTLTGWNGGARPLVSVVVLNWNGGDDLLACLRSIGEQRGVELEVVLVDNASTDGSVGRALELWPSLRVLRNPRNLGFGAGVNRGIDATVAPFVALINPDAVAGRGWVEEMVQSAEADSTIGMVAPKVLLLEEGPERRRRLDSCGHLLARDGQNFCRGRGEVDIGQYDRAEEVFSFSGAACLLRRAMLEKIGGFDERMFLYGEDAELGLRARLCGWKCTAAPAAVAYHHLSRGLGQFSLKKAFYIERNRLWLLWTYYPLATILEAPILRLWHSWRYVRFIRRRKGEFAWWVAAITPLVLVAAKLAAVAGLPGCLARRRAIYLRCGRGAMDTMKEILRRFEITPGAIADRY